MATALLASATGSGGGGAGSLASSHGGSATSRTASSRDLLSCRQRRLEDDLSTPYNHYRCLSPSEQHLQHLLGSRRNPDATPSTPSRFLKRQFSLDKGDDGTADIAVSTAAAATVVPHVASGRNSTTGRLLKQNSAGAAHDLERIEEVPLSAGKSPQWRGFFRERKRDQPGSPSISMSIESLN